MAVYTKKRTSSRKPARRSSVRSRGTGKRTSGRRTSARASAPRTVRIVIEQVQGKSDMMDARPFAINAPESAPRKGQF